MYVHLHPNVGKNGPERTRKSETFQGVIFIIIHLDLIFRLIYGFAIASQNQLKDFMDFRESHIHETYVNHVRLRTS